VGLSASGVQGFCRDDEKVLELSSGDVCTPL
jgi:hypothetical protein